MVLKSGVIEMNSKVALTVGGSVSNAQVTTAVDDKLGQVRL